MSDTQFVGLFVAVMALTFVLAVPLVDWLIGS